MRCAGSECRRTLDNWNLMESIWCLRCIKWSVGVAVSSTECAAMCWWWWRVLRVCCNSSRVDFNVECKVKQKPAMPGQAMLLRLTMQIKRWESVHCETWPGSAIVSLLLLFWEFAKKTNVVCGRRGARTVGRGRLSGGSSIELRSRARVSSTR